MTARGSECACEGTVVMLTGTFDSSSEVCGLMLKQLNINTPLHNTVHRVTVPQCNAIHDNTVLNYCQRDTQASAFLG